MIENLEVPSYDEILSKHNLCLLQNGVDLVLENGDLALTRWGDLRMGSIAQNGLMRFVQHWRFNEPSFHRLFMEALSRRKLLVAHREQAGRPVVIDLATFNLAAYKAAVRPDMSSDEEVEWNQSTPMLQGYSFGQIIVAAANGVRHVDEWEAAQAPTEKQRASMQVLESALRKEGMSRFHVRDLPAEALDILSDGGNFERLAASMFDFAHNVAVRRDTRR
jgi:hypothetical protein